MKRRRNQIWGISQSMYVHIDGLNHQYYRGQRIGGPAARPDRIEQRRWSGERRSSYDIKHHKSSDTGPSTGWAFLVSDSTSSIVRNLTLNANGETVFTFWNAQLVDGYEPLFQPLFHCIHYFFLYSFLQVSANENTIELTRQRRLSVVVVESIRAGSSSMQIGHVRVGYHCSWLLC